MIKVIKEVVTTIILAVLIYAFLSLFIKVGKIDGESMMPTYENGNRVIIARKHGELENDDIVAFEYTDADDDYFEETYSTESSYERSLHIKRIVGVAGDEINITDNVLTVNGEFISEADIELEDQEYTLGEDEYFVQGDNINDSYDSRMHGPIENEDIYGKILSFSK